MAATVVGLPLAAGLFTVGWTFQFVGHVFEGKKPSFVEDKRALVVGLMWWAGNRACSSSRRPAARRNRWGFRA